MRIKQIIYLALYASGINYLYSLFVNKRLYVVMYHSVSSPDSVVRLQGHLYRHISIDVKDFEQQIVYMKRRGHNFISFKDLDDPKVKNLKKPTIIYFDDGFKDVLENAAPVLEKYSAPATLFLVSGVLDKTHMLWTLLFKDVLSRQGVSDEDQLQKIGYIKSRDEKYRDEATKDISIADNMHLFDMFMSWDDVRQMVKRGFELGSHGVSHSRMTELPFDKMMTELAFSKKRIDKEADVVVTSFSLPYGRGNKAVVDSAHKLGYSNVVSRGLGLNTIPPISTPRYFKNISPRPGESLLMFKLRLYVLNLTK